MELANIDWEKEIKKRKENKDYYTEGELFDILKQLTDLDYKYKIGLIDLEVGFESILCAYC